MAVMMVVVQVHGAVVVVALAAVPTLHGLSNAHVVSAIQPTWKEAYSTQHCIHMEVRSSTQTSMQSVASKRLLNIKV